MLIVIPLDRIRFVMSKKCPEHVEKSKWSERLEHETRLRVVSIRTNPQFPAEDVIHLSSGVLEEALATGATVHVFGPHQPSMAYSDDWWKDLVPENQRHHSLTDLCSALGLTLPGDDNDIKEFFENNSKFTCAEKPPAPWATAV